MISKLIRLIICFLMTFCPFAVQAKLSPLAFNRITSHFKEGKEWLSPTFGQVFLASGLASNVRFYGNFIAGIKNGKREWIEDRSIDPTWNLIKALFPSPSGHLTPETNADINFARHAKDPKIISVLLNYTPRQ